MITTSKLSSSLHLVLQYLGTRADGMGAEGPRIRAEGRGSRNTNTLLINCFTSYFRKIKRSVWGILWTNIYALFIWVQAVKRLLVLLYRDRIWNISKLASSGWYMLRVVSVFADQYRMRRKKMICGFKISLLICTKIEVFH